MWTLRILIPRRLRRTRPASQVDDSDRQSRRIKAALLAEQVQRERGSAESRLL